MRGARAAIRLRRHGAASFPITAACRAWARYPRSCDSRAARFLLRRRGHQHGKARVLETDRAGSGRHRHVIRAADHRMGMDVRRMDRVLVHHIDPEAVEFELAPAQIELQFARKDASPAWRWRAPDRVKDAGPPGRDRSARHKTYSRHSHVLGPALAGPVLGRHARQVFSRPCATGDAPPIEPGDKKGVGHG